MAGHGNKAMVAPVTINVPQKNFTFEAIRNPSPQQKSPGNNVHKKVVNLNTHQIMSTKDRSPHVSGNHIKLQQVQVPKKPQIRHSPQSLKQQGPVTNRITLNRVNPGAVVINNKKKSSNRDFTIQDIDGREGTQVQEEDMSKSEEKVMSPKQQEMAKPEGLVHVSSNREIIILRDKLQDSNMRGEEKSGTSSPYRGKPTVKFQGIKNLNDTAR